MFWFKQGLCALPAFLVVWSSATFIVSYIVAIYNNDVDVIFPYISDTGVNPPESCIFGLMTFISACAGVATIYARYKHVDRLREDNRSDVSSRLNKTAFWFGEMACVGMCIVATFQETTMQIVHDCGAIMFFLCGIVYIILQCFVSFYEHPRGSSKNVFRVRVSIALLSVLAFFPTFICAFFVKQTELHRHEDDKDYPFHVASAVCEWIVAFSFIFFFFTYIHDFKLFTLRVETEFEG